MKNILILILLGYCLHLNGQVTIDEAKPKSPNFTISIGTIKASHFGQTVFNEDHFKWIGGSLGIGCILPNKLFVNFNSDRIKARVKNKDSIFSTQSKLITRNLQVGYEKHIYWKIAAKAYGEFGVVTGINQGKFLGYNLGSGIGLDLAIFEFLHLFCNLGYSYQHYFVDGPESIISSFDHSHHLALTSALQFRLW